MGLFMRSGIELSVGMVLMFAAWLLSYIMWFVMCLLFFIVGIVMCVLALSSIYIRAKDTTLIYPLEDHKPGGILWCYVYKDYEAIFTPALREVEGYSSSPNLSQQIKDFKSYRIGNWPFRIVPEGVGTSPDLGHCLYVTHAKKEWGIRSILDLRKLFKSEEIEEDEEEKIVPLKTYQEMKENEGHAHT